MKKYLYKKITAVGILFTSIFVYNSCTEDFLTLAPNHYETEGSFYKTEDDFQKATIGVYADLQNYINTAHFLEEGRSDNTMYDNQLDQGGLGGSNQWGFMDQFKMDATSNLFSGAWNNLYRGIKDANVTLLYLADANIDETVANQLEGELRFLRAFYHFVAVRYWGDIPLLMSPISTADQAYAITRTPVSQVYEAIIEDTEFAVSALPESYNSSNTGRVTKWAARTMLAKVYMTLREFDKATSELQAIVSASKFDLLDDYADIFDPGNKNHAESIFEAQYKEGGEGETSNFIYQFSPVGSRGTVVLGPESGNSGGKNIPTLDMIDAYEVGDLRKEISVGYFDRDSDPLYYVKKYDHDTDPDFARTNDNWPIYRYADVLLMLAEALNEQSYQTGQPFNLLNQVRNRAGLSSLTPSELPNQGAFRDAIARERRVELAFENHRWFDLVRTGKAVDVMTAFGIIEKTNPTLTPPDFLPYDAEAFKLDERELLYPLPSNELVINPNMTQNPGY
jgi:hypothetical protein